MATFPFPGTVTSFAIGGQDTQGLAIGDMNGDRRPDIIATGYSTGTVGVLLSAGKGKFKSARVFTAGANLSSVAVGDLDGDGKLDIAVVGDDLAIFKGRGDGKVDLITRFAGLNTPQNVVLGDFNGDKKLDIAVSELFGTTVAIYRNLGTGTFAAVRRIAAGDGPCGLKAVDVNGDKKLDLVVTNMGDQGTGPNVGVTILLGKGNGSFKPRVTYPAGSRPVEVATGDFNGDKLLDLAVVNGGLGNLDAQNTVSILLNNGSGTFKPAVSYQTGAQPQGVVVADFDADGKADVMVGNYGSGHISFFPGTGTGTLGKRVNTRGATHNAMLLTADFNGDSKPDVVSTYSTEALTPSDFVIILFHV